MMAYDQWLGQIVDAVRHIASREFQEEAWFPGGKAVSSPNEIYLVLMEDNTFDLFFQTYGSGLSDEQMRAANELRSALEQYYDRMPEHPDAVEVLNDPQWDSVRQRAQRFVQAFGGTLGNVR